jgi:drug/metabolite transporter (DMT)-like permease
MLTQKKANFIIVLVVLFWGLSYVLTRIGLDDLGVFNFLAIRMSLGFLIAALFCFKIFMKMNKETLAAGSVLGALLFSAVTIMNFGLLHTPLSNAVFLVSMTAVFVPLFSTIVYRKFPEKKIIVGTVGASIGILFLTLTGVTGFGFGDVLCIIAAALYATHIMASKKFVENKKINALNLGIVQLGFTALYATIGTFFFETPIIPGGSDIWLIILILAVFAIAFGCVAQVVAQKYTSASHVGLIFALEPVFGAIFAFVIYGDFLLPLQMIGAAFLFFSVIWVQLDLDEWRGKREKSRKEKGGSGV